MADTRPMAPADELIAAVQAQSLPARISLCRLDASTVEASDLEAPRPGQGQGRVTMAALLAAADAYSVTLEIEPVWDEAVPDGLSQDDLLAWYRRLGFDFVLNRNPNEDSEYDRYLVRAPMRKTAAA